MAIGGRCRYGSLFYAPISGEATYRWGGPLPLRSPRHSIALGVLTILMATANFVVVLPLVALVQPLGPALKSMLNCLGVQGIDPLREGADAGLENGVRNLRRGYSPTLGLWWRSLYLIDIPWFKFWAVQLFNMALIAVLLSIRACNEPSADEALGGAVGGQALDVIADVEPLATHARKLKAHGRTGGSRGGATAAHSSMAETNASSHASGTCFLPSEMGGDELPTLVLALIALWLLAQMVSALSAPAASYAPATSYASALAGLLALTFLAYDYITHDSETYRGLLSAATFLQTVDVARALLLQTQLCGPYILMLFSMAYDVLVWAMLMLALGLSFAAALYVRATPIECAGGAELLDGQHATFLHYVEQLLEIPLGGDMAAACTQASREGGDNVTLMLVLLYHLISMTLLINMLIAMMAKTFDRIFEEQVSDDRCRCMHAARLTDCVPHCVHACASGMSRRSTTTTSSSPR